MISDERLLPCPFCGGEANCSDYYGEDCIFEYLVICLDCGVSTQTFLTEEEAIEAWNTRKPMERIVERLEQRKNFYENRMGEGISRDLEDWGSVKAYEDAVDIVKEVAQAEPVTAEWVDGVCSNCKKEAVSTSWEEPIYDYDWEENLQYSHTETHEEYHLTDYCPHCGTKMKGGGVDD